MSIAKTPTTGKSINDPSDGKIPPGEFLATAVASNHTSKKRRNKGSKKKTPGRPSTYPPGSKLTRDSLRNVKQRTCNPKNRDYPRYAGRLHEPWQDLRRFYDDVIAEIGERPSRAFTLDRVDGGMYRPGNVRWADKREQARNRGSTKLVTVDGVEVSMAEAARLRGVHRSTISRRHGEESESLRQIRRRERLNEYLAMIRRLGEFKRQWRETGGEVSPEEAREFQYLRARECVSMRGDQSMRDPTDAEVEEAGIPEKFAEFLEWEGEDPRCLLRYAEDGRLTLPSVRRMLDRNPAIKQRLEDAAAYCTVIRRRCDGEHGFRYEVDRLARLPLKDYLLEKFRELPEGTMPQDELDDLVRLNDGKVPRTGAELRECERRHYEEIYEIERAERSRKIRDDFDRLERNLSRQSGTAFNLREMLRPFVDELPGEFVTALYIKMWDELSDEERRGALRRRDEEERGRDDLSSLLPPETDDDPDHPGLSCREAFLDHRDAAISLGEWPEKADADQC